MWNEPRTRLWRDPDHGVLAGVCAGIANYFGLERIAVRLVFVLGLVFFFVPTVLAYVVTALVLPKRPGGGVADFLLAAGWKFAVTWSALSCTGSSLASSDS